MKVGDKQFETYEPLKEKENIEKAVRNLRKAYWSNEKTERIADIFVDAEAIIIIAITQDGYTVVKEQEHE